MNRYQIKALSGNQSELLIYGDIGRNWFDDESVDAREVVEQLSALAGTDLTIRINSLGGSLSDAMAIYNAIKRFNGKTTTAIDGTAYSMASVIAMAAEKISIAPNAMMMIHAPWVGTTGNAEQLREMAGVLDKAADSMAACYARPNVDNADIVAWLADGKDHFFTAQEAIDNGLADFLV